MFQTSNESFKKILSYALTFVLGLLAYYCTERISDYINRPILAADINTVVIRENRKRDWEALVKVRIENIGKSETSVQFMNVQVLFPEYSGRPFHLKTDKFAKIPPKSIAEDEIVTIFPSIFDTISVDEIPTLERIGIKYRNIDSDEVFTISKDSSNIAYEFLFQSEFHGPELLKNAAVDSATKMITLVTREFLINYKGQTYSNKIYPKDANVEYKIENDKIYPQYSRMMKPEVKFGAPSQLLEPFILIPHPDLRDKIVYPQNYGFRISVEKREKGRIVYENYKMEMGSKARQFIYILR